MSSDLDLHCLLSLFPLLLFDHLLIRPYQSVHIQLFLYLSNYAAAVHLWSQRKPPWHAGKSIVLLMLSCVLATWLSSVCPCPLFISVTSERGPLAPEFPPENRPDSVIKIPRRCSIVRRCFKTHTLSHMYTHTHTHTYLQMQPAHKGILSFPYRGVSVAAACAAPLRHNPTVADGIFYYISENRIGNTNLLYRGLAFQSSSANQTKHKSIRSRT